MRSLVTQCIALGKEPSFEDLWIQEMFDRITVKYGLAGRMETDAFIARRLCAEGRSAQLKIRYWRTRRHLPKNREQYIRLGKALELSDEEMTVLLQRYYDSSDYEFRRNCQDSENKWIRSCQDPLCHTRRKFVNEALEQYIQKLSGQTDPDTSQIHYARHLYCIDALNYIHCPVSICQERRNKHLISSSFASEFSRTLMLLDSIPRKTMLRYLFLFYGADVSRSRLDEALTLLGYLPLDASHALPDGQRLDFLILALLERYERECAQADMIQRCQWLHIHCQALDKELQRLNQQSLRFLYFKGLQNFLQ